MKIKAGKFTLAVTLIAAGVLMLIGTIKNGWVLNDFWIYSPIIFVLFGIEIIALTLFYSKKKDYNVYVSLSSVLLVIFMVVILMVITDEPLSKISFAKYFKGF